VNSGFLRAVTVVQAAQYITTGIWPIVSASSFQKVTGPKVDVWLVKTVGVLVTVIGAALGVQAARGRLTGETAALAVGSAAGLAAVETYYSAKGRISPVYLVDAAVQCAFVTGWAAGIVRGRR
jgi:hypothetical protein